MMSECAKVIGKFLVGFFILILFLNSSSSVAQDESSFGLFLASPIGDFKSTNPKYGGFAKNGVGFAFDTKYTLGVLPENWSISIHGAYQWNPMNTTEVARYFTETLGARTDVSDSDFKPIIFTLGPGYDFKLADRITFSLKTGVGLMFNNTKAFTVKVYDANNALLLDEFVNFDNKVAFAYRAGAELKFEIVKGKFAIKLFSEYVAAKQSSELSVGSGSSSTLVDSFQRLEYLNTGFKLVFINKTSFASEASDNK